MKYSHFEELPVWKAAIEFALNLFELTSKADFRGFGDTKNQLERATVSISNNIAEGFERDQKQSSYNFYTFRRDRLESVGQCYGSANSRLVS
jgi:four helix bundle protein